MKKLPLDQQAGFLRSLLESVVLAIVEYSDDVRVECDVTPARVVLSVRVHHADVGLVLGEKGAMIDAIRRIVWTAAKKTDRRVDIDLV